MDNKNKTDETRQDNIHTIISIDGYSYIIRYVCFKRVKGAQVNSNKVRSYGSHMN